MLTRFARLTSRLSIALTLLLGIAACGGGSDSGEGFIPGGPPADDFAMLLELTDADGNATLIGESCIITMVPNPSAS